MFEEEEDLEFAGDTTVETDNEDEEVQDEIQDEEQKEVEEEVSEEDEDVSEDEEEEEEKKQEVQKKKDNKTQALDAERARRKQAEKELKELKAKLQAEKTQEEQKDLLAKEREDMKAKMLEGDLIDEETADKLLEVFGNDVIKNKLDNQERSEREAFEEKFQELKKKDLFMDADIYKPQIRELMKKGLTAEQAYMASISEAKFIQMKKDLQIEAEQRLLNNQERADRISVGVQESQSNIQGTSYSKEEQRIAKETGLKVEEVHKRIKMNSIEQFENL